MRKTEENSKRIAKNTLLLYIRMIAITLVSLYTAKMTLVLLGVEDFGIYNVVAGLVNFTVIVTGTMIQAAQRFLSFDLGKDNIYQFQRTFSMMVNIFAIISLASFLILEMIGPLLIANYLVIPSGRVVEAQWVFQFAIFDFILNTLVIPHTAALVAYEKMNVYAYYTFIDVVLKLLAVFLLYITPYDKLVTFGVLNAIMVFVRNIVLYLYCKYILNGCRYILYWDKFFFLKLNRYVGWSLLGSINSTLIRYGQSVLLNIYFGPIVNAAKAIADKIYSVIYSFATNFYMAVTPQIIKSYAAADIGYMRKIVLNTSKYAYFLLFAISLPLIKNMRYVLILWLGEEQVSVEMVAFCEIMLVFGLIQVLEAPITKAVQATGDIKKYEMRVGFIILCYLPLCYLIFEVGYGAVASMLILCAVYLVSHAYRIYHVLNIIKISVGDYMRTVFFPIFLVSISSELLLSILPSVSDVCFLDLLLNLLISIVMVIAIEFFAGINNNERQFVIQAIRKRFCCS